MTYGNMSSFPIIKKWQTTAGTKYVTSPGQSLAGGCGRSRHTSSSAPSASTPSSQCWASCRCATPTSAWTRCSSRTRCRCSGRSTDRLRRSAANDSWGLGSQSSSCLAATSSWVTATGTATTSTQTKCERRNLCGMGWLVVWCDLEGKKEIVKMCVCMKGKFCGGRMKW